MIKPLSRDSKKLLSYRQSINILIDEDKLQENEGNQKLISFYLPFQSIDNKCYALKKNLFKSWSEIR